MSELIAVGRLAFARSRAMLPYALAYLLVIHVVAYAVWWLFPRTSDLHLYSQELPQYIFGFLGFGSLPLLGATILLFGFEEESNLDEQGTGYPPWLLRTPVASWKLAIVPLILKSAWVILIFATIAVTGWLMESPLPHWFLSSIAMSVLPIWFCSLMWGSFGTRYTRLAVSAVSIVPGFLWGMYCTAYNFTSGPYEGWQNTEFVWMDRYAPLLAFGGWCLAACTATYLLYRARTNVIGRITQKGLHLTTAKRAADNVFDAAEVRLHAGSSSAPNPALALIRYDLSLIKRLSFKYAAPIWLLLTVYVCMVDDVSVAGVIFLTAIYCFIAGFASEGAIYHSEQGETPNFIRSAPIATTTLVWLRQALVTLIRFVTLLGLAVAVLAWSLTGASDGLLRSFEQGLRYCLESPPTTPIAACTVVSIMALLIARHSTWSVALLSSRKQRTGLYIFTAKFLIGFVVLMVVLFRFMKFPNFDSWTSATGLWVENHLYMVPWIALIKIVVSILIANRLRASKLATPKTITILFASYLVLVVAAAYLACNGLPFPKITALHWFSLMAIIVPLGRILGAPLLMASCRHGM